MAAFAELVLAVSDELATLAPEEIDRAIERALGRVAKIVGADRCYVFLRADDGRSLSNTHEWCAAGVLPAKDALQEVPLDGFPWAFGTSLGGEDLAVPRVAEVGPTPERTEWDRESIQSLFLTPLRVRGAVTGFLGCDWVRRADALAPDTRLLVRVAAALIAAALERQRAYRALERRIRFEELVLRVSSSFIDVRGDELAGAIDDAVAQFGRFLGVDSSHVLLLDDGGSVRQAHAWPQAPARAPDLAYAEPSWWLRQLRVGQPVIVACVDELPADEAGVVAALRARGIGALVDVPLATAGRLIGVLGFAAARGRRAWSSEEIAPMKLAAQVLTNALVRAEADRNEARLQAQLHHTQKLESVGQLAGGIAHDFNNLLVGITLSAELARRSAAMDPRALECIDEIRVAADRAAALTKQLLAFSRRQVVQTRPVDLGDLVEHLLRMLRRVVTESIEIDLVRSRPLRPVRADVAQIEQILVNLCVNGRDAMPRGGRLQIRVENVAPGTPLPAHPPLRAPDSWVLLSVADTGVGMDDAVRERCFEPFFTTKPPGEGTGLGLATVYGIVRRHEGFIHVTSKPGQGSTFAVYLPAAPAAEPVAFQDAQAPPTGGRETLLVAEDDDSVRRGVTAILREAGYRVIEARDGDEAVTVHGAHAAEIDLVILDAIMPKRSGLEAYRAIVAARPEVRVLFSSGYSTSVFPDGFFDDGRHRLLEKPYPSEKLLATVRELLAKR